MILLSTLLSLITFGSSMAQDGRIFILLSVLSFLVQQSLNSSTVTLQYGMTLSEVMFQTTELHQLPQDKWFTMPRLSIPTILSSTTSELPRIWGGTGKKHLHLSVLRRSRHHLRCSWVNKIHFRPLKPTLGPERSYLKSLYTTKNGKIGTMDHTQSA